MNGKQLITALGLGLLLCGPSVARDADEGTSKEIEFSPKARTWYVKTISLVEFEGAMVVDDRSGVFGRIPGGSKRKDRFDIPVFEAVNDSGGAIVFVKDESQYRNAPGLYLSDYRRPGLNKQSWDFTVYSTYTQGKVTLFWESFFVIGPYIDGNFTTTEDNRNKVLRQLRLVDLDTGEVVTRAVNKRGKLKTYSFSMDGETERNFRWVQGKVESGDLKSQQFVTARSFGAPVSVVAQPAGAKTKAGRQSGPVELGEPPVMNIPRSRSDQE